MNEVPASSGGDSEIPEEISPPVSNEKHSEPTDEHSDATEVPEIAHSKLAYTSTVDLHPQDLVRGVVNNKETIFDGIEMYIKWILFVLFVFILGYSTVPE